MMKNQKSKIERDNPIKKGKTIGTDKIIRQRDIIKNNLKCQI